MIGRDVGVDTMNERLMSSLRVAAVVAVAIWLGARPGATGQSGDPTLLVRGGLLVDGTGGPARRADLRIAGDTIVEVAPGLEARPGERVVDASGLVVAPGFI